MEHPGLTVPAVALLLFTLGVPCLYYGTEQALALPPELWNVVPKDDALDRYHREAMFGPEHPRGSGRDGLPGAPTPIDPSMPGFGPFGTAGQHVFDPGHPTFRRIRTLLSVRRQQLALRRGRQYLREIRLDPGSAFQDPAAGGLVAWSRILSGSEVLCVANLDPGQSRSADVTVDADLTPESPTAMQVIADTSSVASGAAGGPGAGQAGVPVAARTFQGRRYVTISGLGPAEVLVVAKTPAAPAAP